MINVHLKLYSKLWWACDNHPVGMGLASQEVRSGHVDCWQGAVTLMAAWCE